MLVLHVNAERQKTIHEAECHPIRRDGCASVYFDPGQALLDIERRTTRPRWDGQTPPHDRRGCPATGLRRVWQTNVALQQTHCMLPCKVHSCAQARFGALPGRCALSKYQVAKLASSFRSCLRCFTFSL